MTQLGWTAAPKDLEDIARFFARIIAQDPAYISHGEIQTGLSLDGAHWRPDLEQRFVEDMKAIDAARSVAFARDDAGELIGAAVVHWSLNDPEAPFATLEDLAVEPARRSHGVGDMLVKLIEAEASARGAKWVFLESGKHNHRAHAFFERAGFAPVSHVFAKRL